MFLHAINLSQTNSHKVTERQLKDIKEGKCGLTVTSASVPSSLPD